MTEEQEFLQELLAAAQATNTILRKSLTKASGHMLKSTIQDQLRELDQMETNIVTLLSRRGQEYLQPEPTGMFLQNFGIRRRAWNTDSGICEMLIILFTKDLIYLHKQFRKLPPQEPILRTIFQNYMDSKIAAVMRLYPLL